jgi:hypothetical protein
MEGDCRWLITPPLDHMSDDSTFTITILPYRKTRKKKGQAGGRDETGTVCKTMEILNGDFGADL